MTLDSKNVVSAGLTLLIVGMVAWASSSLFKQPPQPVRHGVVEIQPIDMPSDTYSASNAKSH
jgi:hypothetical protein